jgi:hypothetical protein
MPALHPVPALSFGAMSDRDLIMFGAYHNREKHTRVETELKRAIVRNDPGTIRSVGNTLDVNKPCTMSGFEITEGGASDGNRACIIFCVDRIEQSYRECKTVQTTFRLCSEPFFPLHFALTAAMACDSFNIEAIIALVRLGASVTAKDGSGLTPLHYACANFSPFRSYSLVQTFISELHVKDVNVPDRNGRTPFSYACEAFLTHDDPSFQVLEYLFRCGADVNRLISCNIDIISDGFKISNGVIRSLVPVKATELQIACSNGTVRKIALVRKLIEFGADKNKPLQCTACQGGGGCTCGIGGLTATQISIFFDKLERSLRIDEPESPSTGDADGACNPKEEIYWSLRILDESKHDVDDAYSHYLPAKRKRPSKRVTPIKKRAENLGIELELTPVGVRDIVAYGSPSKKKEARTQLQRLQKARHQKVDRAEIKSQNEALHERRQALDAAHKRVSRYLNHVLF